ncbi:hypothetical protein LOTGIDRAFT_235709 [Lottia gigantea]|uniref:Uncharacterized protein n=1 Tax=Lottia gigantea TaxID=225164 RepID=V3Z4V9_LOTGI|nr:hypothetical protein LOTGIDRAFT_235709 [Lottia gigantea]ESO85738.1 hypothetical protein LOTGIDRAFT_235709 [Lottia gigantea]
MADFNFRQQFPYFRGDGSFRTQGASYRPNGYHQHQRFQNFNWGIPPRGYFNPRFRYDTPRMIGLRDRSFQSSRPTYFNSRYTQCQWYSGLETTGSKGYNQNKGNFAGKQDNKAFGTYLDKLRAAVDRREDEAAEYLLNNFISTTLIKSVKELNRENGKIGKHADRVKYKKPKKFNKNDQIKAYAIDYKLEFIITSEPEIGFVRERGGEGCFVEMGPIVEEDLQKISKYLLETEFDRVSFTGLDEEMMKFYVLMNSVDFLVIPSKNLVYERNKIAGGLFTKSKRTMEDIDDLYLEECPVIFLEGYRETAETTEVELNKKKSVGFLERARRSLSRMLWKN